MDADSLTAYSTTLSDEGTLFISSWSREISDFVITAFKLVSSEEVVPRKIDIYSSIDGYSISRLNIKRSNCASGRGYVPSCSIGF